MNRKEAKKIKDTILILTGEVNVHRQQSVNTLLDDLMKEAHIMVMISKWDKIKELKEQLQEHAFEAWMEAL